jgi:DNA topoisomerase-1
MSKPPAPKSPAPLPKHLRLAAVKNQLPDSRAFAAATGLRWANDSAPGISRIPRGKAFIYRLPSGKTVSDAPTLARIKSLGIPPAWTSVWISTHPHGHIQATGIDARGRKQYRYHPHWRHTRDQTKFERMIAFGKVLPKIRRTTARHLKLPGMPKNKVLAAMVQLLEKTLIRVGNDAYARDNKHFGLTTMRDGHARIRGGTVTFKFQGKSGVHHQLELHDARLAKIIKACQDLPDQELFAYLKPKGEGGGWADVTSSDVNDYLKQIAGDDFTAKDFRTWAGTVLAAQALQEIQTFDSTAQAKKNLLRAIESVAKKLGNTTSVCRKCYIHPAILDAYLDGSLIDTLQQRAAETMRHLSQLPPQEAAVLAFLQERLRRKSHVRTNGRAPRLSIGRRLAVASHGLQ